MALATSVTVCLSGLIAGGSSFAGSLMQDCGTYSIDFSKWTFSDAGRDYVMTAENYDSEVKRFTLRVAPVGDLTEERARLQAALNADLICMRLDSLPIEVTAGRQENDSWLFSAGCSGHEVRMEAKC